MPPLGPVSPASTFPSAEAPETGPRVTSPSPKLFRPWRPSQLPLARAEHGKQAPQTPRWVGVWGRGGRWATWAEGSGLPEPRQRTCVSNFLLSLPSACLLHSSPSLLVWGCNQFGWRAADAHGGGVRGAAGAGNHCGVLLPASSLQAHRSGWSMKMWLLGVPGWTECCSRPPAPCWLSGLGCVV